MADQFPTQLVISRTQAGPLEACLRQQLLDTSKTLGLVVLEEGHRDLTFLGRGKGKSTRPPATPTVSYCTGLFRGIYRVGIETTDKLTDPQIIAKVKEQDWASKGKQILEQTGAEDISSIGETKGDFGNTDRPTALVEHAVPVEVVKS